MRVPEHDEVPVLGRCFHSRCGIAQSATAVAGGIAPARVRAAVRERSGQIRVNPAKRPNRERIAEHVPQSAIALVLGRAQSVAVFDVRAPTTDFALPWAEDVIHADVSAKDLTTPAIVVAGDHEHRNAGVDDVGECGKRPEAAPWDDGLPLEPEFEQIAIDDQRFSGSRNVPKERHDGTLDVGRSEPKVRVGDDVAGRVQHARILPAASALYKRTSPHELGDVTNDSRAIALEPLHHDVEFRVRYAETDQMGVVYHTNYMIWCEVGRTDFIRARGMSYADMERAGIGLAVSEMSARFHAAARYDELIRVRTTLAEVRSRGITFDYLITRSVDGHRLVSARTALVSIDRTGRPIALPTMVRSLFDQP